MKIIAPNRVQHRYTQSLVASAEQVLPLLCPVRETEWAPGWAPSLVVSDSGVMEKSCLFVTPDAPADAIWICTQHDPKEHHLELWKVIPSHTAYRLQITLTPETEGRTAAKVIYTCTALSQTGDAFLLNEFTESWFLGFMKYWEDALNHYLENGTMIASGQSA